MLLSSGRLLTTVITLSLGLPSYTFVPSSRYISSQTLPLSGSSSNFSTRKNGKVQSWVSIDSVTPQVESGISSAMKFSGKQSGIVQLPKLNRQAILKVISKTVLSLSLLAIATSSFKVPHAQAKAVAAAAAPIEHLHVGQNIANFLRSFGKKGGLAALAALAIFTGKDFFSGKSKQSSDQEIEQQLDLSREAHENRNKLNELPTGLMYPTPSDQTIWKDEKSRPWKLNAEPNAAYHQPTSVPVSFVKAHLGKFIPILKVPHLKFISPNDDGRYSEVIANRYTGELVIVQKIMGTFNLCTDAPDGMVAGKLPTDGEHKSWDMDSHEMYGWGYKQIAKGMEIGSVDKGPVILGTKEKKPSFWPF